MALQLRGKGITRVHPLEGGLAAWMALGFPVEPLEAPAIAVPGSRPGPIESPAA